MSLLLFLFYWIAIPVLMIVVAAWLWRRVSSPAARGLIVVACLATLSGLLWLAVGEKWLADRQVRELCAKDGGVKVYETVRLPAEKFNQWGQVNFYRPNQGENALGREYVFKRKTIYLKHGNPDLFRLHTQVIRSSDGKLLGESVFYKRGGGDLPGPWHGSNFMCPELGVQADVLRQVFLTN